MFFVSFLLFVGMSNAKPIDYEDVENLLPTEPQTTNDTLAVIVRDPVVQDAVQNIVGNGSLEGLVVKKKVLIMPATEPTKVYILCSFLYVLINYYELWILISIFLCICFITVHDISECKSILRINTASLC